ncbi:hypothetical protein T4D_11563 [Trichinella pseudospiralis]|uniref:Uncharacterized protein n=1 Tax=Trichinella pseudospiralis TaxID=6337 RepID=A0A0V1DJL4_TRIPS|nr:hypothetical protein T4D_11563 [Trichinella pseudospiralis]
MTNNIKKNTNIRDLIELDADPEHKNELRNSRLI